MDEGPAYGAALLGGVAAGVYADVHEFSAKVTLRGEVTEPDPGRKKTYDAYSEVYGALYPQTQQAMHRLSELAEEAGDEEKDIKTEEDV